MEGYISVISCMGEKLWRERERERRKKKEGVSDVLFCHRI